MDAGKLEDVVGKLARHICLHVLKPLLQLHPHPVLFQTQIQHDSDEGSYSLEVRYGPASAQEGQDVCSVESATLQCLQAITRKLKMAIAAEFGFAAANVSSSNLFLQIAAVSSS